MTDIEAKLKTIFICEHDREGCPYCAEKIQKLVAAEREQIADELTTIRNEARHDAQEWLVNINAIIAKLKPRYALLKKKANAT